MGEPARSGPELSHTTLENGIQQEGLNTRRASIISISSDSSESDREVENRQQDLGTTPVNSNPIEAGHPFLATIKQNVSCGVCYELLWDPYMLVVATASAVIVSRITRLASRGTFCFAVLNAA
ncbi:hypothetical protein AAF712_016411 [Marasmius tenuissimus]|uniref:Uncharacterized protein n=1 Tax=Marasmius tenuissimus TaxID=585030 RepID=A0ABR2Z860_9AGAR